MIGIFYHVALMGNWREVVEEQCKTLSSAGLNIYPVYVGVVGDLNSKYLEEVCEIISKTGCKPIVVVKNQPHDVYELVTMQKAWEWSIENKNQLVLYFHTKGVSCPTDKKRVATRVLADHYLLKLWKENVEKLQTYDVVGVNHWRPEYVDAIFGKVTQFRHDYFQTNYWIATTNYISQLTSPLDFQKNCENIKIYEGVHGPSYRMCTEMWVLSKPCKVYSKIDRGNWTTDEVYDALKLIQIS